MSKHYAGDTYDATHDVWEGVAEAYRCIRQREAAGGPGWVAGGEVGPTNKIFIQRDREEWLVVHQNGRIEHHIENNGPAFLRHGAQARDEWVGLDHVRNYWPEVLDQVEAALAQLGAL